MSPTWLRVKKHLQARSRGPCGNELEQDLPEDRTAKVRGRLAEVARSCPSKGSAAYVAGIVGSRLRYAGCSGRAPQRALFTEQSTSETQMTLTSAAETVILRLWFCRAATETPLDQGQGGESDSKPTEPTPAPHPTPRNRQPDARTVRAPERRAADKLNELETTVRKQFDTAFGGMGALKAEAGEAADGNAAGQPIELERGRFPGAARGVPGTGGSPSPACARSSVGSKEPDRHSTPRPSTRRSTSA